MPTRYKFFPVLLGYHLSVSGKHRIDEVAERMGISASELENYASGNANFPG
jgi:transcriptional regulator with XRE-family HTH domain